MMSSGDYNEYYMSKMTLLKQLLGINEEFMSNLENWESYEEHLSQRAAVIVDLQRLDEGYEKEVTVSCSTFQKAELNRMLNLILAVDNDIVAVMGKERQHTLASMKATIIEKKITGYEKPVTIRGQLLDYKR